MKNFKISQHLLVAAGAMTLLSSCQDEDFGFNATEFEYKQNFQQAFGNVDPNQDWDLYGQLVKNGETRGMTRAASDITVTDLGEAYYRKVTQDDNKAYQKMLPESQDNPRTYAATNLGRVTQNFSAYTTELTLYPIHWNTSGSDVVGIYYYSDSSDSEATKITGTDGKDYYIVKKQVYANKTHVEGVKETTAYDYVTACTDAHWDELVAAYPEKYLISDGTQKQQYGAAIPEGTKIIKSGKQKETFEGSGVYYDVYYRWNDDVDMSDLAADLMALHSNYAVADGTATYKDSYGYTIDEGKLVELKTTYSYGGVSSYQDLSSSFLDYTYLRSKPIKVTIPAGVGKIGFYITNSTPTRYSESKLNDKVTFSDAGEKEACFVATYIDTDADGKQVVDEDGKPVRYLCFEDWMGVATNFDMNDVVFRVYGLDEGGSSIVDADEQVEEALVVCEDLGDFDFDFNDVVFKVQYATREKKTYNYDASGNVTSVVSSGPVSSLRFVPLAAGGTLHSTIVFDYSANADGSKTVEISNGSSNEIHNLLGGSAPSIINAGAEFGTEGAAIELAGATYLPTTEKGDYATLLSRFFAEGRFKIHVVDNNEDAERMTSSANYKTNGVPQMMLLPANYEWAREITPIAEAYPEFTTWVSDATATGWLSSKVASKVTHRNLPATTDDTPVTPTPSDPEPDPDPVTPVDTKGTLITELSGVTTANVWNCDGYFVPSSLLTGATSITVTFEGTHTSFMANAAGTNSFNDSFTGETQSIPNDKLDACVNEGFYICFNSGFNETSVYLKIEK